MPAYRTTRGATVCAATHNWGWGAFFLGPLCAALGLLERVLAALAGRKNQRAATWTFVLAAALAWGAAWWGTTHASGC